MKALADNDEELSKKQLAKGEVALRRERQRAQEAEQKLKDVQKDEKSKLDKKAEETKASQAEVKLLEKKVPWPWLWPAAGAAAGPGPHAVGRTVSPSLVHRHQPWGSDDPGLGQGGGR